MAVLVSHQATREQRLQYTLTRGLYTNLSDSVQNKVLALHGPH